MARPGDTFDRYTIEALLGEGGMGSVYRAHDMRLNRRVAIKVLKVTPGKSGTGAAAARLLREARTVASFDHPNAVTIFDVGEVDGSPYIAMELIAGKTLREYIGVPEVDWPIKIRWLADAARALAAAHRVGLIHRDVKPDNVMVRDDGGVKVLDFGIARRSTPAVPSVSQPATNADADAPVSPVTPSSGGGGMSRAGKGHLLGSPLYMSPEQFGANQHDARSDQFAWGVTAWHVLAGSIPWGTTANMMELVSAVMVYTPPSLRELVPDLPEAIDRVIARAMSKTPGARYASMDALLADLDAAIGPTSGAAPPRIPPPEPARVFGAGEARTSAPEILAAPTGEVQIPTLKRPRVDSASAEASTHGALGESRRDPPAPGVETPAPTAREARGAARDDERTRDDRAAASRVRRGAVAVALLGVGAVAGFALSRPDLRSGGGGGGGGRGVAVTRASSAPGSGGGGEEPASPPTPRARAIELYTGGVAAWSAGDSVGARERFTRALAADGAFGPPHLRLALLAWESSGAPDRAELDAAVAARATLEGRDRALLDLVAPCAARAAECEAGLARVAATPEANGEVWLYLGLARLATGDAAGARAAFTRATTAKPTLIPAWRQRVAMLEPGAPTDASDAGPAHRE